MKCKWKIEIQFHFQRIHSVFTLLFNRLNIGAYQLVLQLSICSLQELLGREREKKAQLVSRSICAANLYYSSAGVEQMSAFCHQRFEHHPFSTQFNQYIEYGSKKSEQEISHWENLFIHSIFSFNLLNAAPSQTRGAHSFSSSLM
jgi:hypothetical protein